MMWGVPLPVKPPIPPMLAKLQTELPRGDGWRYEPKWDGFRAIVFRDGADVYIQSRDTRPFNRYFPELIPAFEQALGNKCVVDGEIVVAGPDGLAFDSLQMRLHPAESRVRMLSQQIPASFVAFDLLAVRDRDLREEPLAKRRAELEKMLPEGFATEPGKTQVFLTPQTDDAEEAEKWFDTSAFVFPEFGSFGNSGRNILEGPGFADVSFSVTKDANLRESVRLQFRTEFFNTFNHPNFDLPDIFMGSPAFGRIPSAQNPRRIQFGLKVLF